MSRYRPIVTVLGAALSLLLIGAPAPALGGGAFFYWKPHHHRRHPGHRNTQRTNVFWGAVQAPTRTRNDIKQVLTALRDVRDQGRKERVGPALADQTVLAKRMTVKKGAITTVRKLTFDGTNVWVVTTQARRGQRSSCSSRFRVHLNQRRIGEAQLRRNFPALTIEDLELPGAQAAPPRTPAQTR